MVWWGAKVPVELATCTSGTALSKLTLLYRFYSNGSHLDFFFTEELAYFSKTVLNFTRHPLQQNSCISGDSGCWTDLPAAISPTEKIQCLLPPHVTDPVAPILKLQSSLCSATVSLFFSSGTTPAKSS